MTEVAQIQAEMAKENPRPAPTVFPNRMNKPSTVIMFCALLILAAIASWLVIRNVGGYSW